MVSTYHKNGDDWGMVNLVVLATWLVATISYASVVTVKSVTVKIGGNPKRVERKSCRGVRASQIQKPLIHIDPKLTKGIMFFFFGGDAEVNKSEQKLTNQWIGWRTWQSLRSPQVWGWETTCSIGTCRWFAMLLWLLLDEPTSGLDANTAASLAEAGFLSNKKRLL